MHAVCMMGRSLPLDDSTEVYNVERDEWRAGPQLPYQADYPGEFVSHGKLLFYVGGTGEKRIHRLNGEKDGWIYVIDYLSIYIIPHMHMGVLIRPPFT